MAVLPESGFASTSRDSPARESRIQPGIATPAGESVAYVVSLNGRSMLPVSSL